jgi:hypothetical protein
MAKGSPRPGKIASAEQAEGRPRLGTPPGPLSGPIDAADPALAIESARYIAQMSGELASMARNANLDLLAYFLDMARVEATSSIRKLEGRPE